MWTETEQVVYLYHSGVWLTLLPQCTANKPLGHPSVQHLSSCNKKIPHTSERFFHTSTQIHVVALRLSLRLRDLVMTKSDNLSSQQSGWNNSLANIHKWVCTAKVTNGRACGRPQAQGNEARLIPSTLFLLPCTRLWQSMTERPLACFPPASDSLSSQHSLLHSLLWQTTVSNSTHAILSTCPVHTKCDTCTVSAHTHIPVLSSPGESLGSVLEWPGRLEEEKEKMSFRLLEKDGYLYYQLK